MERKICLPYIDALLKKFESGDIESARIWGSNVHFGYWDNPRLVRNTSTDFINAGKRMNEIIFQRARLKEGLKVLDVGCGFGGTIKQLDRKFNRLELVGLNIDSRQLARASSMVLPQARNRISFIQGDACKMPFEDQSFHIILAVECIFHFESRLQFLKEAKRVLKPGGQIVISDFVYFAPTLHLVSRWLSRQNIFREWGGLNFVSQWGYRKLNREVGFQNLIFENMTSNTLPNYEALFKSGGTRVHWKHDFIFRLLTNYGFVKYMIVQARAPE